MKMSSNIPNSDSSISPPSTGTRSEATRTVRFNNIVTEHNYTPQQGQSQMDSDAELAEALQKLEHTDQGEPAERGQMSDLVGLSGLSGMGRGGIPGTNSGPFSRTTYMTTATRTQGMGRGGIPGTNSGPFSTTTYMATATRTQGPYGHMGGGVESVSTLYSRSDFGGFDMRGDMSSRSPGGEGYQGPPGMHEYMQRSDIYGSIGQGRAIQQGKVPGMTGMTGSLSQGARMPGMTGLMGQGAGMPGMRGLMSQGAGMPGMTGSLSQGARMPGMAGAMGHGKGQEMPGSMYGMPNAGSRGRGQRQDALIELLEREKIKAQTCEDSLAHGANTIIILDTSASMLGEPFQEAVEAIENFLLGLEENAMEYGLEENVGLITFGSEDQTGVVQHMTNDFSKIRDAMGNLTPGGMSPLSAALFCILGLFGRIQSVNVSGHVIPARVIIVSDGNVNEGPDTGVDICMDQNTFLEISNNVMDLAHNITEKTKVKMYFIPVGNPNEVIPDMLTAVTGGSVVLAGDVKWLSRSYIHHLSNEAS
ncbi:hypothetical protein KUTeg_018219 [Tegillarca granosa]|uniref:VWFA domain-containing protein n=1 Tax=Tegillarca granosa TaxID=220873 RepID=A0ABQ9EJQ1_TEGGR|nr:hypothetical protein KUTeg_018219 [Tegillarca granosa]